MSDFYSKLINSKGDAPCSDAMLYIRERGSPELAWKTCDNIWWIVWYLLDFDGKHYYRIVLKFEKLLKPTQYVITYFSVNEKSQLLADKIREVHPELPEPSIYSAQELANLFNEIIAEVLPLVKEEYPYE